MSNETTLNEALKQINCIKAFQTCRSIFRIKDPQLIGTVWKSTPVMPVFLGKSKQNQLYNLCFLLLFFQIVLFVLPLVQNYWTLVTRLRLVNLNELIQNTFCATWNSSTGSNYGQMFWYLHQSQWLNTFFKIKSSILLIISVIDWRGSRWCCRFSWSWPTVCSGLLCTNKIFFGQFPKSGVQAFDQTLCNFNWIFSKNSLLKFRGWLQSIFSGSPVCGLFLGIFVFGKEWKSLSRHHGSFIGTY